MPSRVAISLDNVLFLVYIFRANKFRKMVFKVKYLRAINSVFFNFNTNYLVADIIQIIMEMIYFHNNAASTSFLSIVRLDM